MPDRQTFIDTCLVALLRALSFIPLCGLYGISTLLSWLLFNGFHFQRKLVINNLRHAFPDLNAQAIKKIARKTYQHHLDIIVELIKTQHYDKKTFLQHISIDNAETLNRYLQKKTPVLLVTAHAGNWEWMQMACAATFNPAPAVIYKKSNHPVLDQWLYQLRQRFGSQLIATTEVSRQLRKGGWIAMAADLGPRLEETRIWLDFMGMDTAFYSGLSRIAAINGSVILYAHMLRTRRGHYQLHFEEIARPGAQLSDEQLMKRYIQALEEDIHKQPADWLWFYKRWKHTRPDSSL